MLRKDFVGIGEFARHANTPSNNGRRIHLSSHDSWYSGLTGDKTLELALKGDDALVAPAQALIDQMDSPETTGLVWSPSPFGAYPVVPEYLAGEFQCMRLPQRVMSERGPIRIFCDLFASSGIKSSQYQARGNAIIALLMRLQVIRPVELILFCGLAKPDRMITILVDSKPLDISVIAFAITNVAFFRHFGIGILQKDNEYASTKKVETSILQKELALGPEDIYLDGHMWEGTNMITNPVEWVNEWVPQGKYLNHKNKEPNK